MVFYADGCEKIVYLCGKKKSMNVMKSVRVLLLLALLVMPVAEGYSQPPLTPNPGGGGPKKIPSIPAFVFYNDGVLVFDSTAIGLTLKLLQANEVVLICQITESNQAVEIPVTLSGEVEIRLYDDDDNYQSFFIEI